jgi:PAS domain S-box-containing protein
VRREAEEPSANDLDSPDNISELLLAAIVDSCDDAIISKDLTGTITSWNKAATRIFGYAAEEMVGQPILRLIPKSLHGEEVEILRKIRAGERIYRYETRRIKKDGDLIDVSLTISPIYDRAGRVIGASKIAHDISERVREEQASFLLAAIVASSDDSIVSTSLDGTITTWNQAAQRMFGYTTEEIIGQSVLRIIPENLHGEEVAILDKIRAGERTDHYETTRIRKDGESIQVSLSISPVMDGTGRVIGTSKIARDISRQKQMERLLIQSEKLAATGRMAATMAHEINNPLESVMNLVFLARQSSPSESKAREYLETAEREIERVSHIARQTLGYYRDTGRPVEVLPHELLQDVLSVYETKLRERQILVECQYEMLRPMWIRKGELVQVFSNIIANSIDAMPRGGMLQVRTSEVLRGEDGGAQIVIRDHGAGIDAEHLHKVFEPFFSTKGDLGNGIGLWIAKQLVENHGGEIQLTSTTDGSSGTTVSIFLPFQRSKELTFNGSVR